VTSDSSSEEDVRVRIRKVNGDFIQLYPIWKVKGKGKDVPVTGRGGP
jgi:hypothetical protein